MAKTKNVSHESSDLILHSNPVTTARYDLSPLALKAFLLAYSKLTPEDKEFAKFTFPLGEVARLLGNPEADYRKLVVALRVLQKESIYICEDGEHVLYIPIPTIRISEARKTITFTLNPDLQPHFLGLKQQYTMFPVEHAFRLGGRYSIRMYQLVMQWQGKERKNHTWDVALDVQELREMWGIKEGEYRLMSSFRRDVIERAVMEINSAQLGVVLTALPPKKNGKNITHFVLEARRVSPSEPRQVHPKPATSTENEDEKLIKKHPDLWAKILDDEMKQGDLFNPISPSMAEFEARSRALLVFREAVKKTKKVGKLGVEK